MTAAAILDPIVLRPGGEYLFYDEVGTQRESLPSYTCPHCNRVMLVRPERKRPRNTCARGCPGWVCDLPGCNAECRNLREVDGELALLDYLGQPWFLRDSEGYPVDRIYLPDGTERLIRRKDNGMTEREMARQARPQEQTPEWVNPEERGGYLKIIDHMKRLVGGSTP